MSAILGIHSGHDASAVVFKDGDLFAAISEERLTRVKNDGGRPPDLAIDTVLRMAGAARNEIDALALQYTLFMSFAPSALEEFADEIFVGVGKAHHTAAFMTITFDVKPDWRSRIPAVVHIDGTARPQLVNRRTNPLYHKLIKSYYELSGIPLVLNTSFNVHEEPIVCEPKDAIKAFIEKRVDCLAIGSFWLEH